MARDRPIEQTVFRIYAGTDVMDHKVTPGPLTPQIRNQSDMSHPTAVDVP